MSSSIKKLTLKFASKYLSRGCQTDAEALSKLTDKDAVKAAFASGMEATQMAIAVIRKAPDFPLDPDCNDDKVAEYILSKMENLT